MVAYTPQTAFAVPVVQPMMISAPQQQGMFMVPGPNYMQLGSAPPNPFAILAGLTEVKIKQQIQWAQVLIGWDMPNKFIISDPATGHDLFVAAERSEGLMGAIGRQIFEGGSRPFTMDIAMLLGPGAPPLSFVRLERPYKCTCCCCQRPVMSITNALTGQSIGSTIEPFSCCHYRLGLRDNEMKDILSVNHHCCDCSILCWGCPCGCQETSFKVHDGDQTVGEINRKFNVAQAIGMVTGVNADSDEFIVKFRDIHSPEWKAALIGMALFLDYCYFTKGGKSAREQSALGRATQANGNVANALGPMAGFFE